MINQTSDTLKVKNLQYFESSMSPILVEWESEDVVFLEGGKLENVGKTRGARQELITNSTDPQLNPSHLAGRRVHPIREHPSSFKTIA